MAWACRRAGADDQILGANHDRRHRPCRADPSATPAIPALAGAVGGDRDACGGDDPAFHLADAGELRSAHLCRRILLFDRRPHPDRQPRVGYVGHNFALLALPVVLAAVALTWPTRWRKHFVVWSRGDNSGVQTAQAL